MLTIILLTITNIIIIITIIIMIMMMTTIIIITINDLQKAEIVEECANILRCGYLAIRSRFAFRFAKHERYLA